MAENGADLTPAQKRAIAALLTARDNREAAKTAGIAERTLYRWLEDPAFKAALTEREGDLIDAATRRLISLQDTAIDAFTDVFARADEQAALNVAEFFTEEEYLDKDTGQPATRLVLDIEKITELGRLVKRLKVKRGHLEVESYDAQAAAGLKLRAAGQVLDYLMRLRELRNVEERLAALESVVYDRSR